MSVCKEKGFQFKMISLFSFSYITTGKRKKNFIEEILMKSRNEIVVLSKHNFLEENVFLVAL